MSFRHYIHVPYHQQYGLWIYGFAGNRWSQDDRYYGLGKWCLQKGQFVNRFYYKAECGIDGCKKMHHQSLHKALAILGIYLHSQGKHISSSKHCLLQLMKVKCVTGRDIDLNTLWGGGPTLSMITFNNAKEMQLLLRA